MGTRAAIAQRAGDGFVGRYHHWDGYPSGLGATLFALYQGHFKRDVNAMIKYLIEDHPAGWSTINGADFTQPPGYNEGDFHTSGPYCYCHGGRSEGEQIVTEKNASNCGCEWAYVLDGDKMHVLSSYTPSDTKMIGMFGCGDPNATWREVAAVDLNGDEPDWKAMEGGGD